MWRLHTSRPTNPRTPRRERGPPRRSPVLQVSIWRKAAWSGNPAASRVHPDTSPAQRKRQRSWWRWMLGWRREGCRRGRNLRHLRKWRNPCGVSRARRDTIPSPRATARTTFEATIRLEAKPRSATPAPCEPVARPVIAAPTAGVERLRLSVLRLATTMECLPASSAAMHRVTVVTTNPRAGDP